jgi:hypothetical protein
MPGRFTFRNARNNDSFFVKEGAQAQQNNQQGAGRMFDD